MPPLIFPSEEELASGGGNKDFKLLPEEDYVFEIAAIEVQKDKVSIYSKRDENDQPIPEDEWLVRLKVVSFKNGDPIYYEDGSDPDPTRDVRLTTFVNPNKVGMLPQPSKARKFITSALNVPLGSRVEIDGPEELIGKRLAGRVYHKLDGKKVMRDRVDDFTTLRTRPPRKVEVKTDAEVQSEAVDLLAKAKDIFNEDELQF